MFNHGIKVGLFARMDHNYLLYLQKAEAQLAYELQAAKIQQRIRNEEIQIQVILSFVMRSSLNVKIFRLCYTLVD